MSATKEKDAKREARATAETTVAKSGENNLLELGATMSLSAADAIADPNNDIEAGRPGKWTASSYPVVIATEDHTLEAIEVVGAAIGKSRVSYAQKIDVSADDAIAAATAGAKYTDDVHARHSVFFDIEVVPVGSIEAPPASPLSSSKFDGLLPMNEPQEEPSEKTPYGMDQENKPVAPFPGMVRPDDDSTVARQSEDAVRTGSAAGIAKAKEEAKEEAKTGKADKEDKDDKKDKDDDKKKK